MHSRSREVLRDKSAFFCAENTNDWGQKMPEQIVVRGDKLFVADFLDIGIHKSIVLAETLREISQMAWKIAPVIALYGRMKSIQSTLAKMCTRGLGIEQVLDIVGVRVILPRTEACYRLLEQVHARFAFIGRECDDYIRTPKPSGYRSLHTTILTSDNRPIEIQIRTLWMHMLAENGRASHFLYKQRNR